MFKWIRYQGDVYDVYEVCDKLGHELKAIVYWQEGVYWVKICSMSNEMNDVNLGNDYSQVKTIVESMIALEG